MQGWTSFSIVALIVCSSADEVVDVSQCQDAGCSEGDFLLSISNQQVSKHATRGARPGDERHPGVYVPPKGVYVPPRGTPKGVYVPAPKKKEQAPVTTAAPTATPTAAPTSACATYTDSGACGSSGVGVCGWQQGKGLCLACPPDWSLGYGHRLRYGSYAYTACNTYSCQDIENRGFCGCASCLGLVQEECGPEGFCGGS